MAHRTLSLKGVGFMEDKIYDERPWGTYEVIERTTDYWVKNITVKPGARLSLQYHGHRSEEWIVVRGNGYAVINGEEIRVRAGSHLHIGVGDVHRIANDGEDTLVFIEVALGTKLSESDIVRVEDDYNRE